MINQNNKKRGITLIEAVIYTTLLAIILFVIAQTLGSLLGSHRRALANRSLESSGLLAMEKITREVRLAEAINTGSSILGLNSGKLVLSGVDSLGVTYSLVFEAPGGVLQVTKNGGPAGNLTSSSVRVVSLLFERVVSTNSSEGLRTVMVLESQVGNENKTLELKNFTILRGSY